MELEKNVYTEDESEEMSKKDIEAIERRLDKLEENKPKSSVFSVATICSILSMIISIVAIGEVIYRTGYNAATIDKRFDTIESRLDSIEADIRDLQADVTDIKTYLYGDGGVQAQLADINQVLQITPISVTIQGDKSVAGVSVEKNELNISQAALEADSELGENLDGTKILAEDMIGQKILLTYQEDNKEIYFYGQYNANYHWDGQCLINVYNMDGTLYGICESDFDDGNRLDYKSIVRDNSKDEYWIYSDKVFENGYAAGTNTVFNAKYETVKNFSNDTVKITDLLRVDRLVSDYTFRTVTYYHGKTLNSLYNDKTGNAYLVNYDKAGNVDSLYIGCFVDGKFNDDTDKAIEIVYDSSNGLNKYFYYEGSFIDGKRASDVTSENYITLDTIEQLIRDKGIDCSLDWK